MVPNLSVITKLVNTKRQKNHLTDFSWATKKALYSVPDSARANSNTILYAIFNLQRTEKCKSGTYCKQYDNLYMIMCQCIAAFVILRTSLIRFFSLIHWACATSMILDPLLRKNIVQWRNSYWRSASLLNTATGTILPRGLVWEGLPRQERQSWGLFLWIDNE